MLNESPSESKSEAPESEGENDPDDYGNINSDANISMQYFDNYSIEFVSNGDGTCYVSKIINTYECEEQYELVIPEASPVGDTVVEIRTAFNANIVPQVILKEDFEQILYKIAEMLAEQNGITAEEIIANPFMHSKYFKYSKVFSYYSEKDPYESKVTEKEYQYIIDTFPITEYVGAIYLCSASTLDEFMDVNKYIQLGYSSEDFLEDYRNLCNKLDETCESAEEKARIMSNIPKVYSGFGKNIIAIRIPSTVEKIEPSLFSSCTDVKEIEILNSVSHITEITSDMFYCCTSLQRLILNDNIKSISSNAFINCYNLESVIVFKSITSIDDMAFTYCYNEKGMRIDKTINVYYEGTKEEWENIDVGKSNDRLLDAVIHYNYINE